MRRPIRRGTAYAIEALVQERAQHHWRSASQETPFAGVSNNHEDLLDIIFLDSRRQALV